MLDLIYGDDEARKILAERFPSATFEDASDDIHRERFQIELEIDESEYYQALLDTELALVSLNFQLSLATHPERVKPTIDRWLITRKVTP